METAEIDVRSTVEECDGGVVPELGVTVDVDVVEEDDELGLMSPRRQVAWDRLSEMGMLEEMSV